MLRTKKRKKKRKRKKKKGKTEKKKRKWPFILTEMQKQGWRDSSYIITRRMQSRCKG